MNRRSYEHVRMQSEVIRDGKIQRKGTQWVTRRHSANALVDATEMDEELIKFCFNLH